MFISVLALALTMPCLLGMALLGPAEASPETLAWSEIRRLSGVLGNSNC
jgi:hypothetical protein